MVLVISKGIPLVPPYSGYCYTFTLLAYGSLTLFGYVSQHIQLPVFVNKQSYNPDHAVTSSVWASPRSLATTCGITIVFFSCGYLDVSVHRVCLIPKDDDTPAACRVAPFGIIWIYAHVQLPIYFRSLSRPSSPLRALGIPHTPLVFFSYFFSLPLCQ